MASAAQEMRFEVDYSENYALLDFLNNLSQQDSENPYAKVFVSSEFNTEKYNLLIQEFSNINIFYSYEYPQYPYGNKIGGNTYFLLGRNLMESKDLDEFKRDSFGIIPNQDLDKLYEVLFEFKPIYRELVFNPCREKFEIQLEGIRGQISNVDIDGVFRTVMLFHRSVWDTSLPFKLYIFPIPDARKKGFTATAFYNLANAGIPQGYQDFDELLSVLFHESFHILYDEQPLNVKQDVAKWFFDSTSSNAIYAQLLFNEAITTSIANGYLFRKLTGSSPKGDWYNNRFISEMAKALYPSIEKHLSENKEIDQQFITTYISLLDNEFPDWITNINFIMMQRFVIAENQDVRDALLRNHSYANIDEFKNELTPLTINEMKLHPVTKVIVVTSENQSKLNLVKDSFDELLDWTPNANADFVFTKFLENRSYLIIINSVLKDVKDLMENLKLN